MGVRLIKVCETFPLQLNESEILFYLTDQAGDESGVVALGQEPCDERQMVLRMSNYSDVHSVIGELMCGYEFSMKEHDIVIYSDGRAINSKDLSFLCQLALNNKGIPILEQRTKMQHAACCRENFTKVVFKHSPKLTKDYCHHGQP